MGNSFTLIRAIDYKKLDALSDEVEILIGYPEGLQHTPGFEGPAIDMADLAQKMSMGAGPQTWKTKGIEEYFKLTKSGKPRKRASKRSVAIEHHVDSIPARPFIEDGIEQGTDEIDKQIEKYYKQSIESGERNPSGLHAVAVTAIGAIQKLVRGGYYQGFAPNSQATIKAKGSDKPLIDTGQLLNSLTYVIGNAIHKKIKDPDGGKSKWTAT